MTPTHPTPIRGSRRIGLISTIIASALALLSGIHGRVSHAEAVAATPPQPAAPETLHDLAARRLGGELESLSRYRGQVLLVVNTASRCGHTPQYEALQKLHSDHAGQGFAVLGFPSNDFGEQEPGSDAEIGAFCRKNYGVSFPMFSKVQVGGERAHPVYAFLTSRPGGLEGPVQWNFEKFLVDRDGHVVKRFSSRTRPDDPAIVAEIDRLLERPVARVSFDVRQKRMKIMLAGDVDAASPTTRSSSDERDADGDAERIVRSDVGEGRKKIMIASVATQGDEGSSALPCGRRNCL